MQIFSVFFALGPWVSKNLWQVFALTAACLLAIVWSRGCKPHWFSNIDVWGVVHHSGGSLKPWSAECAIQTHYSSGRRWKLGVPSQLCDALPWRGIWYVSALLTYSNVGIFSFTVVQLISGFLSAVIALYVTVYLMCLWEEGSLGVHPNILVDPAPKVFWGSR